MSTHLVVTFIVLGLGVLVGAELVALMWAYRPHAGRRAPRDISRATAIRRVARSRLWFRRVSALDAVERMGDEERAAVYREALVGARSDHLTTTPAAMALAELRGPDAIAPIVAAIDAGRLPAFAGAAAIAAALPAAEDIVAGHLTRPHADGTRRALAAALGEHGGPVGVRSLGVLFGGTSAADVKLTAAEAILASARRGVPVTGDVCLSMMDDPEPRVRAVSAALVALIMGDEAEHALVAMLDDQNWGVARAAAEALCDLPAGPDAAERILAGLSDEIPWQRRAWELIDAGLELRTSDEELGAETGPAGDVGRNLVGTESTGR